MSYSNLYISIIDNRELSKTDKIILPVLINLDKDRHCIASNRYLAQRCGMSENTITASIARLEQMGLIDVSYGKANRRTIICQKQDGFYVKLLDEVIADTNLTSTDKIVYSFVLNYEKNNRCFISNEKLAEKIGVSVKTIARSIKHLIENGYITERVIDFRRFLHVTDKIGEAYYNIYNNKANISEKISISGNSYSASNNNHGFQQDKNIVKGNTYIYNYYTSIYNSRIFPTSEIEDFEKPLVYSMIGAIHENGGIGSTIKGYEITPDKYNKLIDFVRLFAFKFHKIIGKSHPYISTDTEEWGYSKMWNHLSCFFESNFTYLDLSPKHLSAVMDLYFKTKFNKCDYRFSMFVKPGVFLRRVKEMERIFDCDYNVGVEYNPKPEDNFDKWWMQPPVKYPSIEEVISQSERNWWED